MKKLLLVIFLISLGIGCTPDTITQPAPLIVYNGNVILRTQADVDAFGTQGYTVINGFLNIGDRWSDTHIPVPSDITDLSPLNGLTQIASQLEVQSNPQLTSLQGLENLEVVAGLVLSDNENLTSLTGLEGLKSISGHTFYTGQVFYNGGLIFVFNNPSLASVEALGNITPQTLSQVTINNSGLSSLAGLENIVEVSKLYIVNNDVLTSLEALEGLININSTVFITGNDTLTNYCILQNPIGNNPNLEVYNVLDNQFNPTQQNIISGNCSQ